MQGIDCALSTPFTFLQLRIVTIADLAEFLAEIGERDVHLPEDPAFRELPLSGVRADTAAGPGELGWISPKVLAREPQRPAAFRGSALVCPAGADGLPPGALVVRTADPKALFVRITEHFFPGIARVEWPAAPASIAADARIGRNVRLAPGVVIGGGTEIGDNVSIGPNTCVAHTTIHAGVTIGCNCAIGLPGFGYARESGDAYVRFPHLGRVVIESDVEIGSNTCIDRGSLGDTVIRRGAKIDNLVHVAHNCDIGEHALVIAHAMLGGSVRIGPRAWIAPSVAVMNQATVGADAVVGLGAVVVKSVPDGTTVVGNPAKPLERKST